MQNTYYTTKGAMQESFHGNIGHLYGKKYFVDSVNGADTNTGLSWMQAKATIQAAVNAARRDEAGDLITTKDLHPTIAYSCFFAAQAARR